MSKRDCNRKGYLKGSVRSRIVCEKQLISIEKTAKDKKEIRKPQLGPRALAWNEFKKTGKIDRVYEMIAEIYGENTFSNNVILRWINEEMQKEEQKREDLAINVCKEKHLTNTRASGSDDALRLVPPIQMSLEKAIEFIQDDELVEVTPKSIRLRKKILDNKERERANRNKQ